MNNPRRYFSIISCAMLFLVATRCSGDEPPADASEPEHLSAARLLLSNLELKNTSYEHGRIAVRFTEPGLARTDCSGFADALLKHCYHYDADRFRDQFGSARPTARLFHDTIDRQIGFERIEKISEIEPGDFLAIKFLQRRDSTGHVMLAVDRPVKISPTAPVVKGTTQWKITVIDSSKSGHGPTDTRHNNGADGRDHDGLGQGICRLYSDAKERVVGFTWSTTAKSRFKRPSEEHMVIGRLEVEGAEMTEATETSESTETAEATEE